MRQIGTLPDETEAERFAAFLITSDIIAHAEEDGDGWAIWVRDENQLDDAKKALSEFRVDPRADRYAGAERKAAERLRSVAAEREQAKKNVVTMRGRWKRSGGVPRRRPLIITIMVMSVGVYLTTNGGGNIGGTVARTLLFVDPVRQLDPSWNDQSPRDLLIDIRRGEIWRIVTPIFIHFGTMHVVFNMLMFYQLGSLVEDRRGTWRVGLIILSSAAISNLVQCLLPDSAGGGWLAGGMSGVLYALFGYAWMKTKFQPELGILIPSSTVVILIGWMLLGMSGAMEQFFHMHMANWAHGMGFVVGVVVGYAPMVLGSPRD
jgi:GlpG protein